MPLHVEDLPDGSKLIRLYPPGSDADEAYAAKDEFAGACVLTIVDGIARIIGAVTRWQHPIQRRDLIEMLGLAKRMNARQLRIARADGHTMPRQMFRLEGDEWVTDL